MDILPKICKNFYFGKMLIIFTYAEYTLRGSDFR